MLNLHNNNNHSKKAIIIGAGIVGLTTACRLAEEGYLVTIIEQKTKAAEGTSNANAGQLIYNFGAMGSPSFIRSLPKILLNTALHGVIATGLLYPGKWPWALSFIRQCTSEAWLKNSLKLIKMAHRSRDSLTEFCERYDIEFKWRKDGKIITHETEKDLKGAEILAEFHRANGGDHRIISKEECFEREGALIGTTRKIAGGTYLPEAAVGDCHLFCENLAELLTTQLGGKICFNVNVEEILHNKNKVIGIKTPSGILEADIYVVCAGLKSNRILPINFPGRKLITGIKGISLTYPSGSCAPNLSVTDMVGKFVVTRLGERVRVTGYAIFCENLDINQKHVTLLSAKAKSLMPQAALYSEEPYVWTGLRPQTPDDLPMVGKAGAENLYVNAGHGSNGWLLAFGAAELLLEKINE